MSGSFSSSARVRLVLPPPDGAAITNRVPAGVIGAVAAARVAMRVVGWTTSSTFHLQIPVSHWSHRRSRLPTGPCRSVLGGLLDVLHLLAHLFDQHFYFQSRLRQF